MKARAMVLEEFNKPLVMREFELKLPEDGELLVKIEAAGVCGSDAHIFKGNDPRAKLPMILGHEGVGRVETISGNWKDVYGYELKEGDLIIWDRGVTCGKCYYCTVKKEPYLCQDRWTYGISVGCNQPPYLRGCYSEYIYLDKNTKVLKIDNNIEPEILVSASCSGATCAHAFDTISHDIGDTVLIQGPGPIGLYAILFAKEYGAQNIVVIGGTKERLNMCKEFGATIVLDRNLTTLEQRKEIIMDITKGKGVDLAIEAVGHPSAVSEGIKLVRNGGNYLSLGFGDPNGTVTIDCYYDITRKNLRYQGIWVSDTKHLYMAANLVLNNKELFKKMITNKYKLSDATQALMDMANRNTVKSILIP
ncbi:alcohol dehydrogenase [Thermoanaerobacterium thermosaccharolyticum]|uniref:zinc-binding dehydrogenase n=1 Tax=Thermoanaerobacterium thermosaccharolyticum TaxID=1517 RepID=UPI000C06BD05|nr:zinc-binding dehydrogenase [Thermoanaerobacterium thermosaccharolyticum]PHO08100.1 alcohol dehydrogenase [Thermoanaerobacterium thermosaccharolyticum]